ncbi:MAG TPA: hypothetical protein VMX57_03950, partial [Planctomycetota bacterium]|nr:hypothetical protein [Planctomycetota bacterium]
MKKLLVTDCRAVRGFIGAPVDGSTRSWGWDANFYEYNARRSSAGVGYHYRRNDGLHVKLADKGGFNAIQIRGGVRAKVYRDVPSWTGPEGGTLIATLPGGTRDTSRLWFEKPVATTSVSFFDVTDGYLSDVSFFRLTELTARFPAPARTDAKIANGRVLDLPIETETPLDAVGLSLVLESKTRPIELRVVITDPVDSRRELFVADFTVDRPGIVGLVLDFPDQIIPAGGKLQITVECDDPVKITDSVLDLYKIEREHAAYEALAYRKLLLHGMYCAMSEARPWNGWFYRDKVAEWFASDVRYVPCVRNILDALEHCRYIDREGADDDVRQYYEWIWRDVLRKEGKTPPFETKYDFVEGAPEWASLARQAWLQARAVPRWWLENRLVPTGEFGGVVGDDTDMYQNYADFVMFETDGVAAALKDAAARLAQLAQETTMTDGINRRTMDPLHAYEEGLNQDALLAFWHYGDPVYLERCMASARSVERCTVVTPKGHRHFRSQEIGADRRDDPKTDTDGHAHPLMWHPAFEVVRYNANPTAMKWLGEWADGWLEHMAPGKYAHSVEVAAEKVTGTHERPLYGGYGGQGSAFESLYWVTGDGKYLAPFMEVFRTGKASTSPGGMVAELYQRGALDDVGGKLAELLETDPVAHAQATGDKQPLVDALKVDVTELQRYGNFYTTVEPFTDRVFLYAITTAARCYTGGFATRNKYCRTHAVSYEGLGT